MGKVRLQAYRFTILSDGSLQVSSVLKRDAEVIVRFGVVRLQT